MTKPGIVYNKSMSKNTKTLHKMNSYSRKLTPLFLGIVFLALLASSGNHTGAQANTAIGVPVLKWQRGGCYNSWCETGWYSSPATADLNSDGQVEVIASAYSIFVLNGSTGVLEWKMSSGHDRSEPGAQNVGRTWPGIVIADIDDDGALEIVTAHSGGWVSVYNAQGYFEPGWPKQPTSNELRGLLVSDLDGDTTMEIITTGAVYGAV